MGSKSAPRSAVQDEISAATSLPIQDLWNYWVDGCQRSLLLLEVLTHRAARYAQHAAKTVPHVLRFQAELIMDGRQLARPVNYLLARIVPPHGVTVDSRKRPFVVIDPRAGHGPGIGGFKADSEIGVALKAGHPCYFVGFLPEPVADQTIEDVIRAEAAFLERVIALHPEADGKPAVIGNCQAGWSVMMLAAVRPELFGPIIVAGSPLSYWAGVRGQNPMRYTGGLLGGSWLTALLGDLGNGKFDGAWLVANFENLNPSNTFWTKHYNLYSKIDTEGPRYLEFEQWWGGHALLNAEEMQWIVDNLFIGNKLATADIVLSDHSRIDLRNIRSPILVFCSKGDNITPPPQALGWIRDLYSDVDQIRMNGQTIVYAVHESIGHLGIFVSGSVAKKEHDEFASNIDLIDILPPGLYEAVMTPADPREKHADLIGGGHLVRFEERTIDEIRALCGEDEEEERKFATVARVSDINLGLYRTFLQPWVRLVANEATAEFMRRFHPARLQYEMFARTNPFIPVLAPLAELARQTRLPVAHGNAFWFAQEQASGWIEKSLDGFRETRDQALEEAFHAIYGSPLLQALVGFKASDASPRPHPGEDVLHRAVIEMRKEAILSRIREGGPREAVIRALFYVRMPDGAVDERGFRFMQRLRDQAGAGMPLSEFKAMVRDQFFMLMLDPYRAVAAIPDMLAKDPKLAAHLVARLDELIAVVGLKTEAGKKRLSEIKSMTVPMLKEYPRVAAVPASDPPHDDGALAARGGRAAKRGD